MDKSCQPDLYQHWPSWQQTTSLQSYHLPETQSLRKCFWSPIGTTVAKETLAKKRNQNKEKKIPHIRAGYQDPKPKKKLIRPTIQVKNITCLLRRVLFQESCRPSTMQSKQCRHFQRRLISKPLTLNRSLKPFLPPQRFALRRDSWY
jgi:hypothetical protein